MSRIVVQSEGKGVWMDYALRKLLDVAFPGVDVSWGSGGVFSVVSYFPRQEKIDHDDGRPYVVWSGENSTAYPAEWAIKKHPPIAVFHSSLAARKDYPGVPFFHLPFAMFRNPKLPHVREIEGGDRFEFLAYVASNPVAIRDDTFRLFEETGRGAKAYGQCCKNIAVTVPGGYTNLTPLYARHRFALVFENADEPGYVTEKIVNAFMGGSVPLYWGSDGYAQRMFNRDAFIDLADFRSAKEMVEYVLMVDSDPALLRRYQTAPVFPDGVPTLCFDFETPSAEITEMAAFLRDALSPLI
jgi:hypothetical protein